MRSYLENHEQLVGAIPNSLLEGFEDHHSGSKYGGSNELIVPERKRIKTKGVSQGKEKGAPRLSKSQKRKLKQLQEEKERRALELKSIRMLEKYKIQDDALSLLQSSGNMGQVETMQEKRRRAVQLSKAGLEVPQDIHASKKMGNQSASCQFDETVETDSAKSHSKRSSCDSNFLPKMTKTGNLNSCEPSENYLKSKCSGKVGTDVGSDTAATKESCHMESATCMLEDQKSSLNSSYGHRGKNILLKDKGGNASIADIQKDSLLNGSALQNPASGRSIVHVSRPYEVDSKRGDLPIVMMEQEIMEAINEHSTVIICGETGCGKTTQVPQFLYEAGFGSKRSGIRMEVIGITQPRRVAVLATAKRVAFELGLCLGKDVGFQVRHDKMIGENCSIKFMTDGILLRELQSDFLLKRYSIIILDEAHERSLNTDILVGMLSRIIRMRQKLCVEQRGKMLSGIKISPENMISQLKLVLMSATMRVEDFASDRRLFHEPPPVIEVPTRQFPVTIHFSRTTELEDYVGQAYKKVMLIHKKLPPGGILVFVTGQREVEYLCRKLRKASQQLMDNSNNSKEVGAVIEMENIEQAPDTKDISEAFELCDSSCDEEPDDLEKDIYFSDSGTESGLVVGSDDEDSLNDETSEGTSTKSDALRQTEIIASLRAAFEALAGNVPGTTSVEKLPPNASREGYPQPSTSGRKSQEDSYCPGALYVLPLYAMLPAAAQLRVFQDVREGERLVVVATNVAETSLTIPGIKYVVDTGREKVKKYNYANGIATYDVQWISKASAAQRAGRAGRTGPGHCYRLYSSAVFNNSFSDFSTAEITKIPVDGVVLLLKFMGIDKVANFPFPTPPEPTALVEAERCLKALEALDNQGRLTAIGKAMAQYPMSPRHSRMLLTVISIMKKLHGYGRANLVLAYAVAAAAALSFSNPLNTQFGRCHGNKDELGQDEKCATLAEQVDNDTKQVGIALEKIPDQQEKLRQKKRKAMAKVARAKFCNPSSDALTTAYALQLFELSENQFEFCETNALHLKTMDEMSKLRRQLLQLIFHQSAINRSQPEFSWPHGNIHNVEDAWKNSGDDKHPLLLTEEELLGQAICAGWADRVAKRVRKVTELSGRKANAPRYQACMVSQTVFLHRWSSVFQSAPEFLVYNELIHTKRPYMHGVTCVKPDWLVKHASSLCSFSAPLTDPKPYYEPLSDQILCWVNPTFGPHLWQLPLHSLPIKNDALRVSVFACALLEGNVLPCLKSAQKFLSAPSTSVLRPEAAGQRRVGNLLNKLMSRSRTIDSRATLQEAWNENPQLLYSEILQWFQERYHDQFKEIWAQMHHEVILEVQELFPKRKKKERKGKNRL